MGNGFDGSELGTQAFCLRQLAFSFFNNNRRSTRQFINRCDIPDACVVSLVVVMRDKSGNDLSRLLQIRRCFRANTLALERLVPPLDLAIGLRIKRRGSHMGHPTVSDKRLEGKGNKLRTVVRDDTRPDVGNFSLPL